MGGRIVIALAVALLAAGAVVLLAGSSEPDRGAVAQRLSDCDAIGPGQARRECFATRLLAIVGRGSSTAGVARVERAVNRHGGFAASNCHVLVHEVGRRYARRRGATLASLMDLLPRSDDPGCAAGFSHGMLTAVAPDIDLTDPRASAKVGCGRSPTRFQLYSCIHGFGHAFMRIHDNRLEPALRLCRDLGTNQAPDCAQGAYHDYWLAVAGLDRDRDPRRRIHGHPIQRRRHPEPPAPDRPGRRRRVLTPPTPLTHYLAINGDDAYEAAL